jgi:SacI homology domain
MGPMYVFRSQPLYIRVTSGPQIIVNLAEQHGREGILTNAYREYVEEVKLPDVKYVSCELYARVH